MAAVQVLLPLPVLPQGWTGEKGFKPIGELSSATQRNIEPVGPHFLAHARRVCHCFPGVNSSRTSILTRL